MLSTQHVSLVIEIFLFFYFFLFFLFFYFSEKGDMCYPNKKLAY